MLYLKYLLVGFFILNVSTRGSAQDTLLLHDGQRFIVEVNRIDNYRFYYKDNDITKHVLKRDVRKVIFYDGREIEMPYSVQQRRLPKSHTGENEKFYSLHHKKIKKPYRIWVTLTDQSVIKGYLKEVGDSLIVVYHPNYSETTYEVINSIATQDIKKINIKKKGRLGRSILTGALSGLVIGGIMGYSMGKCNPGDFCILPRSAYSITGALIMSCSGAAWGAIIGAFHIRVPIKSSPNITQRQQETLLKYKSYY